MSKSRKRIRKERPTLEEILSLAGGLKDESDRGAALIASSFVDDSLAHYLLNAMVDDKVSSELVTEGPSSALGTFSVRLKMAFALGLISPSHYRDLNTIREIRNDFAHFRLGLNFDDSSIHDKCKTLMVITRPWESDKPRKNWSPRWAYLFTCTAAIVYFSVGNVEYPNRPKSRCEKSIHKIFTDAEFVQLKRLYG